MLRMDYKTLCGLVSIDLSISTLFHFFTLHSILDMLPFKIYSSDILSLKTILYTVFLYFSPLFISFVENHNS